MQSLAPARQFEKTVERFERTVPVVFDRTVPVAAGLSLLPDSGFIPPLTDFTPRRQSRRVPMIVRVNRLLRTLLVTFCGLALLGYGLDVAASSEVAKLQEQARRLSEQNTELSAQLLRAISFQGIQANVVGKGGLHPPDQVVIVKEQQPPLVPAFRANKYYRPLMSGY